MRMSFHCCPTDSWMNWWIRRYSCICWPCCCCCCCWWCWWWCWWWWWWWRWWHQWRCCWAVTPHQRHAYIQAQNHREEIVVGLSSSWSASEYPLSLSLYRFTSQQADLTLTSLPSTWWPLRIYAEIYRHDAIFLLQTVWVYINSRSAWTTRHRVKIVLKLKTRYGRSTSLKLVPMAAHIRLTIASATFSAVFKILQRKLQK